MGIFWDGAVLSGVCGARRRGGEGEEGKEEGEAFHALFPFVAGCSGLFTNRKCSQLSTNGKVKSILRALCVLCVRFRRGGRVHGGVPGESFKENRTGNFFVHFFPDAPVGFLHPSFGKIPNPDGLRFRVVAFAQVSRPRERRGRFGKKWRGVVAEH